MSWRKQPTTVAGVLDWAEHASLGGHRLTEFVHAMLDGWLHVAVPADGHGCLYLVVLAPGATAPPPQAASGMAAHRILGHRAIAVSTMDAAIKEITNHVSQSRWRLVVRGQAS